MLPSIIEGAEGLHAEVISVPTLPPKLTMGPHAGSDVFNQTS